VKDEDSSGWGQLRVRKEDISMWLKRIVSGEGAGYVQVKDDESSWVKEEESSRGRIRIRGSGEG
jgi:hypothetical protein